MAPRTRARPARRSERKSKPRLVTDPETSARLGRIRQRDTSAEMAVRRIVYSLGYRYRVSNRDLPGSPDLANRKRRWAIFVHGCFWHRHAGCPRATTPKRNRAFWLDKLATNVERDKRAIRNLTAMSFRSETIWECELENPERMTSRIRSWLMRKERRQNYSRCRTNAQVNPT